ncbi:MAG: XF1762 family protein [Planctomycetota bacterium]
MTLQLQPITFAEASEFIRIYHRHHPPSVGWLFGIAVSHRDAVCGVIVVGRPVARHLDDGWTAEVTRCCTDGTQNACSMLYASAWRAVRAMGYRRLISYTLKSEGGASMRASGYRLVGEIKGSSWSRPSRPRVDKHTMGQRLLWEKQA